MQFTILHEILDVASFVKIVHEKADTNKKALGFLPKIVYQEAAEQKKLLVAATALNGMTYAGHLLYGGMFPSCRIFQLFVDPSYRGCGIGRRLLDTVIAQMESNNYLSITARVASDLYEANLFWEKMGFLTVLTKLGGASRGRMINLRSLDLKTPSLFSLLNAKSKSSEMDNLRLVERLTQRSPIYVIDLNVLFDIVKKRIRSEDAGKIISAGLQNLVRIAVTEEFIIELKRTSHLSHDPVLDLALQLPLIPNAPDEEMTTVSQILAPLIFPERTSQKILTLQDYSDLRHISTAIHHRAAGFITSEKAILRARTILQSETGIDIIGVGEFAEAVEPIQIKSFSIPTQANSSGIQLKMATMSFSDVDHVRNFLRQTMPHQNWQDILSPPSLGTTKHWFSVKISEQMLAFVSWETASGPTHTAELLVTADEDHPAAENAINYLLDRVMRDISRTAPAFVRIRDLHGHPKVRKVAISHGFRPGEGPDQLHSTLYKLSIGKVVTPELWSTTRIHLKNLAGVNFPTIAPKFSKYDQPVSVISPSGEPLDIPLNNLEDLLSPTIFLLPHRDGTIVPIRRAYVEDLLGGADQLSLLASPEAMLMKERAYFSNPRTASLFDEGRPIIFYESGKNQGRAAAVAIARVSRSAIEFKTDISQDDRRRGVLSPDVLNNLGESSRVVITTFTSVMLFLNPVPFVRLRELECVDQSNLVTSRRLESTKMLKLIAEGQPYA